MKRKKIHGFSLVELTVVLLIITLLAGVALRSTNELSFQVRYEQTKERLEMIRQAILGNPRQIINGQQAISGFVADMGRLPYTLRELIEDYDCDGPLVDGNGDTNFSNDGGCPWSLDLTYNSGLGVGWRGPYLDISGNPNDTDAFTDGWGTQGVDDPSTSNLNEATAYYGWRFFDLSSLTTNIADAGNLIVQSLGKNQKADNSIPLSDGYDNDYPENYSPYFGIFYPKPLVSLKDWQIIISGGISVNFKKTVGKTSPVSHCSDQAIPSKSLCSSPAIWYGGCSDAGYYNKSSCASEWIECSDGVSITKAACEAAGKEWYGQGFGCSDQSKPIRDLCSGTWRSCSDDGTIVNESDCLAADQIWYGDNIFNNSFSMQKICMKVFYRKSDATIGIAISDPISIIADGSFQSFMFTNFKDSVTNSLIDEIIIGTNAIAIYKHDGTNCTNFLYPSDRRNLIQVDFHPHTNLPVINW